MYHSVPWSIGLGEFLILGVSARGIIVPIVRIPIMVWMMIPHHILAMAQIPIACNSSTHMTILPSDYCKLPITPKRLPNNTHWKENSWQWSKVLGSLYCHPWWCCWRCVGPTAAMKKSLPFGVFYVDFWPVDHPQHCRIATSTICHAVSAFLHVLCFRINMDTQENIVCKKWPWRIRFHEGRAPKNTISLCPMDQKHGSNMIQQFVARLCPTACTTKWVSVFFNILGNHRIWLDAPGPQGALKISHFVGICWGPSSMWSIEL